MPSKDASGKTTWSTPEVLTAVAVAVAVGVATGFFLDEAKNDEFDEDRPPIIVSNGSADFEGDNNHPKYGDASWTTKVAKRQFNHVQPNGATVVGFLVDIHQGNPNAVTCTLDSKPTNLLPPFFATEFTVAYGVDGNNTPPTATFAIDPDNKKELLLSFSEDTDLESNNKRAKVKDVDNQPQNKKKIRWFEIGGATGYRCTINTAGTKLNVRQLH
jgi:hypothetical protein